MDYREAIGEVIVNAGAAAVVGFFLLIVRWIVMGIREDLRRWTAKRQQKRLDKQSQKGRVEPTLTR